MTKQNCYLICHCWKWQSIDSSLDFTFSGFHGRFYLSMPVVLAARVRYPSSWSPGFYCELFDNILDFESFSFLPALLNRLNENRFIWWCRIISQNWSLTFWRTSTPKIWSQAKIPWKGNSPITGFYFNWISFCFNYLCYDIFHIIPEYLIDYVTFRVRIYLKSRVPKSIYRVSKW